MNIKIPNKIGIRLVAVCFLLTLTGVLTDTSAQTKKTRKTSAVKTTAAKPAPRAVRRAPNSLDVLRFIHQTAAAYGIPPKLYEGLLRVEGGSICNSSPKGARGIAQLMPDTARRFGLTVNAQLDERCDVGKSIIVGAKYIRFLLDTFRGNVPLALAGYNAGEGAVMKYGWRIPPYRETVQYVEKIGLFYTGKAGMSIPLSYDQVKAVRLIEPLYSGRGVYYSKIPETVPYSRRDGGSEDNRVTEQTEVASTVSPDSEIPDDESPIVEKPTVKPVRQIVELEPRIKTGTIRYWNNQ